MTHTGDSFSQYPKLIHLIYWAGVLDTFRFRRDPTLISVGFAVTPGRSRHNEKKRYINTAHFLQRKCFFSAPEKQRKGFTWSCVHEPQNQERNREQDSPHRYCHCKHDSLWTNGWAIKGAAAGSPHWCAPWKEIKHHFFFFFAKNTLQCRMCNLHLLVLAQLPFQKNGKQGLNNWE